MHQKQTGVVNLWVTTISTARVWVPLRLLLSDIDELMKSYDQLAGYTQREAWLGKIRQIVGVNAQTIDELDLEYIYIYEYIH